MQGMEWQETKHVVGISIPEQGLFISHVANFHCLVTGTYVTGSVPLFTTVCACMIVLNMPGT